MNTQRSHHRSRHWKVTRQAGARAGRLATLLAAVISGLLASTAIVPAAFAQPIPIGNDGAPATPVSPPTIQVVTTGGMAGWQIALIAVGAALIAAAAAVLLDRKLTGRHGARHHRLMRSLVTARHACLTTGPLAALVVVIDEYVELTQTAPVATTEADSIARAAGPAR